MTAAPGAGLLAQLDTQPRVRDFLSHAVTTGRVSHAYLFVGAPGSGKLDAAWALAQALLCENDGCGACDACVRVARHTHPDVHVYEPESATGYLIAQVRAAKDFAGDDEILIYIDPADIDKKNSIAAAANTTVMVSKYGFGGGIRAVIKSRGILIDQSFETKVKEAAEGFVFHL